MGNLPRLALPPGVGLSARPPLSVADVVDESRFPRADPRDLEDRRLVHPDDVEGVPSVHVVVAGSEGRRAIARAVLSGLSEGRLDISDSALYQALQRLEERGLVAAEWGATENNRRARYYSLTGTGEHHLRDEVAHWLRYSETLNRILTAT